MTEKQDEEIRQKIMKEEDEDRKICEKCGKPHIEHYSGDYCDRTFSKKFTPKGRIQQGALGTADNTRDIEGVIPSPAQPKNHSQQPKPLQGRKRVGGHLSSADKPSGYTYLKEAEGTQNQEKEK